MIRVCQRKISNFSLLEINCQFFRNIFCCQSTIANFFVTFSYQIYFLFPFLLFSLILSAKVGSQIFPTLHPYFHLNLAEDLHNRPVLVCRNPVQLCLVIVCPTKREGKQRPKFLVLIPLQPFSIAISKIFEKLICSFQKLLC